MGFDRAELADLIARHGSVARIVVLDIKGSTPRDVGTAMYVWDTGQHSTIGGGALEFQATLAARQALGTRRDFTSAHPLGPSLGQCCGGFVQLLTEIYDAQRLATLTDPYVVRPIGSSLDVPFSIKRLISDLRNGNHAFSTQVRDGWIIEPVRRLTKPLWIWGAGHVGRALVSVLSPLPDFEITWIDTQKTRFPDHIPSGVSQLYGDTPERFMAHAPHDAYHLILTFSHALDLELCHQALLHDFSFVGLIGSRTKMGRFRSKLRNLGHLDTEIDRITCPIGLPALGKHPQQIAIGVAQSLIQRSEQHHNVRKETA